MSNIKIYDETGERETVSGLALPQGDVLMTVFKREGVKATLQVYNEDGTFNHEMSYTVNAEAHR